MSELIAYSERGVRAGIAALPDGRYEAEDVIEAVDGDLEIRVAVDDRRRRGRDRLRGHGPAARGNLNCPLAVTRSACSSSFAR